MRFLSYNFRYGYASIFIVLAGAKAEEWHLVLCMSHDVSPFDGKCLLWGIGSVTLLCSVRPQVHACYVTIQFGSMAEHMVIKRVCCLMSKEELVSS
ncbi:hypothetical protein BJ878DRAFT_165819 [Calycina marina]|uniref:Uncharacterized protein n=1 Tax=Calycina marina TaxID=1763456 RepID=A0A9P8CI44_9HELO|nr:hypothetical protein BJ878DRAFT_165819 [Calycina marina]